VLGTRGSLVVGAGAAPWTTDLSTTPSLPTAGQGDTGRGESRRSVLLLIGLILAVSAGTQWWQWQQDKNFGLRLASLVKPGDIMLLTSDTCTYCAQARAYLKAFDVPFSECSIERDSQCAERYRALKSPGTPVVLVKGDAQVGFMPTKVMERLTKA